MAKQDQYATKAAPEMYLCQQCDVTFKHADGGAPICPVCRASGENLVPIYMENDPAREQLLTAADYAAGD